MNYGRFFAMIATSTVVMFGLMYLNTYALDHIFFSQTRMWMPGDLPLRNRIGRNRSVLAVIKNES